MPCRKGCFIWPIVSAENRTTYPMNSYLLSLSFCLAIFSWPDLYSMNTDEQRSFFKDNVIYSRPLPKEYIDFAAFTPDGIRFIETHENIDLWDGATKKIIHELKGHEKIIRYAAFSLDGNKIVSGSDDKTAKIWDVQNGELLLTLIGHTKELRHVSFSYDGSQVVTASLDGTVKIWDAETGVSLMSLELALAGQQAFLYPYMTASFSPDGAMIVVAYGKSITLWNKENGQSFHTLSGPTYINAAIFSLDGLKIFARFIDDSAMVWDVLTGEVLHETRGDFLWLHSLSSSKNCGSLVHKTAISDAHGWFIYPTWCVNSIVFAHSQIEQVIILDNKNINILIETPLQLVNDKVLYDSPHPESWLKIRSALYTYLCEHDRNHAYSYTGFLYNNNPANPEELSIHIKNLVESYSLLVYLREMFGDFPY